MKKILVALALLAMFLPVFTFAVNSGDYGYDESVNDVDTLSPAARELNLNFDDKNDVTLLILRIIGLLRTIFWILTIVFILWAAYLYLFAGASGGKADQANKLLQYAVIAIIIALVATSIPYLVKSILS